MLDVVKSVHNINQVEFYLSILFKTCFYLFDYSEFLWSQHWQQFIPTKDVIQHHSVIFI